MAADLPAVERHLRLRLRGPLGLAHVAGARGIWRATAGDARISPAWPGRREGIRAARDHAPAPA